MTATSRGPAAVREPAPAKLNLYLHVVGKRADGYHLLDSLVAFTVLGDELVAAPAAGFALSVIGPFAAALERESDNLVLRAARALDQAFGGGRGAEFQLVKALPVASGIGGGSSDAAATLRALARLWNLDADADRIAAIARTLGADVPVCIARSAAYMGGIGEELAPAPRLPPAGVVLVNPGIALPTPSVFKARQGGFSPVNRFTDAPRDARHLAALLNERTNDLSAAAIGIVPSIAEAIAALAASPGCLLARMSGSGATCFGLFTNEVAAVAAADWIAARRKTWWVAPTRLA